MDTGNRRHVGKTNKRPLERFV